MKKNFFFIVLFLIFIVHSYGQGTMNFKNYYQKVKDSNTPISNQKSTNDAIYLKDSSIVYNWDLNGNFWDPHWKSYNTYDNRGNLILSVFYMKDYSTSQFLTHEKNTYTYNSSDQLILDIISWWDSNLNNWFDGQKNYYFYNTQGKLIKDSSIIYDQQTSAWDVSSKTIYEYDNNGYLVLLYNYSWSGLNWEYTSKSEYTNNLGGKPITIIYSNWNLQTNNWENNYKTTLTYNLNNGEVAELEGFMWNTSTLVWDKQTKIAYLYNSNNKVSEITYYYWLNSGYVLSGKITYSYDAYGNEIENLFYNWNSGTSTWNNSTKTTNFWSLHQVSSVLQPYSSLTFNLYPNPVKDFIYIDGSSVLTDLKIYSIDGKLVDLKYLENNRVDVSNLNKGFYIISYNENGVFKQKKFIKQ